MADFKNFVDELCEDGNLEVFEGENNDDKFDLLDKIYLDSFGEERDNETKSINNAVCMIIEENVSKLNKETLYYVLPKIGIIYHRAFTNDNYIQQKMSVIRKKIIKPNFPREVYDESQKLLKFDEKRKQEQIKENEEKVNRKNANRIVIHQNFVFWVLENFICGNVYDRFIAVLIATGVRYQELYTFSEFANIKGCPGWIQQRNILKSAHPRKVVLKPVILFNSAQILENIKLIRDAPDFSTESISKRIKDVFNRFAEDREFSNREIGSHLCRKIYGNLAYKLYGNSKETKKFLKAENPTDNYFLMKVLGHEESSLDKSLYYNVVDIQTGEDGAYYEDMVDDINLTYEELENDIKIPSVKGIRNKGVKLYMVKKIVAMMKENDIPLSKDNLNAVGIKKKYMEEDE
jgi:hypothetical protein